MDVEKLELLKDFIDLLSRSKDKTKLLFLLENVSDIEAFSIWLKNAIENKQIDFKDYSEEEILEEFTRYYFGKFSSNREFIEAFYDSFITYSERMVDLIYYTVIDKLCEDLFDNYFEKIQISETEFIVFKI